MRISDWSSDVCSSDLGGVSSETIFADRLSSACGRLSEKAPTTAFAFVKADDLQLVGTVKWDAVLAAWVIDTVGAPDLFTDWTGHVPELRGTRAQRERAAGVIVRRGPYAQAIVAWQTALHTKPAPVGDVLSWAKCGQCALRARGATN